MKIVTLVKYVPDATGDRGFADDNTVDREREDGLLSELDEYAVEQALQLADDSDDVEVVALTLGPDDAADAIKRALQMGASAGVHINDESVHGSDAPATSTILAAAIRKLEPDLVIAGMASTDGTMGVVPAMISERLGWPAATLGATLSVDGGTATIRRDGDTASQTVEVGLPAIVSVTDQSGEARYPSFKGIMAAKNKPVDQVTVGDLGLPADSVGWAGARQQITQVAPAPAREAGEKIEDDGEAYQRVVQFLEQLKVV
jgi:electron transfer flavoprotein beta subunit